VPALTQTPLESDFHLPFAKICFQYKLHNWVPVQGFDKPANAVGAPPNNTSAAPTIAINFPNSFAVIFMTTLLKFRVKFRLQDITTITPTITLGHHNFYKLTPYLE
jgi:hypothetical protein